MHHIASDSREGKGINIEDGVAVISFRCKGLKVNPNKQQEKDSPAEQLESGTFFFLEYAISVVHQCFAP